VTVWVVSHQMDHDQMLTVCPERFIAGGEALVRVAEQPVTFVRGAIPGETVQVRIVARKKQWRRAEVTEVVTASPHRVTPPCPKVAQGCGGCDWQHLDPVYQLEAKYQIAVDALVRGAGLDAGVVSVGGAVDPVGYRTTLRVRGDTEGRAGLYAHGSHRVVGAQGCLVAHPGLHKILDEIEIDPGIEVTLRISAATGQITAIWDDNEGAPSGLLPEVACGPSASLHERVSGVDLAVSAGSFFQSGPEAAELLVATVRDLAPEIATARHIVDAYGGVGLFAATLAPLSAQVTLIESNPAAITDARINLSEWVSAGRGEICQIAMEEWEAPKSSDVPVDLVIADPARQGLDRAGLAAVASTEAPVVILVSCDPASAARDLRLAGEAGYEVTAVKVLDLFPHTHHVELVSRLVRRSSPSEPLPIDVTDVYASVVGRAP
jgi:23S rRNA (uracil1939-C5)-methyltransferase